MHKNVRIREFERSVKNKFNVYNSLFLNLPFKGVGHIGMLIPLLHHVCKSGLEAGREPLEIMEDFFNTHARLQDEEEKIEFMFAVIRYVERQVVLYDSVEDAAFPKLRDLGNDLSLKDFLHLGGGREQKERLAEKLASFSARIVLTAHPTQFYPPAVLDIINRLRRLITDNRINDIDITLQQLGLTSLLNAQKPTPLDEAKNIIYFLRNVYYEATGALYADIKNMFGRDFHNPGIIRLGFWPGGDRDGNPYVTSETTLAVAAELRMTLMKCYYRDIKSLEGKLTFRAVEEPVKQLRAKLYTAMFDPEALLSYEQILHPLLHVRELLKQKYNSLYLESLEAFIDKVHLFKTHFASLDIRQDHGVHKKTVQAVLKRAGVIDNSLEEMDGETLTALLLEKELSAEAGDYDDPLIRDTLETISSLKKIQRENGEEGCNRYVISNSEDIFSVLFVFALFRWCGWPAEELSFDIIPLFESMTGMENSAAIMEALFSLPAYRAHLERRGLRQTMMLGFSDGTKDGGYLRANWSIFKTKENLSAVCARHGIKAIFFDGRGGPPARGGGMTHRFYAAQSEKIANNEIQLTIQGQTISSLYGTREHFIHNSEQLLTAGLSNTFFERENTISEADRQLIEELARLSYEKYQHLKNHEMFIPYLENKSTLKYYGRANIGSRPAKRGHKKQLTLKDLRAISFVGSWSQLKQNVPGYYGMGTALKTLADAGRLEELKTLFRRVPFFKALILNSMMSLSKCCFGLTAYIARDEPYREFWNMLHEEFTLSRDMMLQISGYSVLMEEEPVSRNSIAIREDIVLPLLVIQQYALQKIEQDAPLGESYEKMVKRSLYGNINASRNSA
ncbi:MAG TPA: phosphoenolpyruvate carboxylase [Caldithrix abyssi]|uniref:Phosphoenolpyruvate carboxylase n=1 Tax=Caldithrix abyssi TaxID=187145 RepID=A0A7V1PUV6_CALAY|nr:phosphoenolpyruvate carboxylase [Caldithrix abyssi]